MAKEKKQKKKFGFFKKLLIALLILFLLLSFFAGGVAYSIIKNAPTFDSASIYALLSESSYLYDDKGILYERLISDKYRTNISYSAIPEDLIHAFIAIEDKTFWEHHGFNFVRIFGAIFEGLQSGGDIRGTSTITQQLARNLYLSEIKSERTVTRKLIEAYYTVLLERNLTKKQILEAYLNTIYLGYGANGVQAAANAYFGKDVKQLTIAECAVLATITKNPSRLSPVKRLLTSDVDPSDPDILISGKTYTTLYNDTYQERQQLVLREMYNADFISFADYQAAKEENIREALSLEIEKDSQLSSYFSDYVIMEVAADIAHSLKIDEKDAYTMLYNSGLMIYSTVDTRIQGIVEDAFKNAANFPAFKPLNTDKDGHVLAADDRIMLYRYECFFDEAGNLALPSGDYELLPDGTLLLYKDKKLVFETLKQDGNIKDVLIQFKDLYSQRDDVFHYYNDAIIQIPAEEKQFDASGNLLISAKFVREHSTLFKQREDGSLALDASVCNLSERILQPQGAMAIIDYTTGAIKALVGGRDSGGGKLLFNRATAPHPPGSAIKPLSVYIPALRDGWTAASIIEDAPLIYNGKLWPRNSYSGYKGKVTLRSAVEDSMNVPAVKVNLMLTPEKSAALLKELGVTTVIESGYTNDINPAAMALGGMTYGISPLEMTAAYGTIANGGIYQSPISYTKVLTKNGDTLLQSPGYHKEVFDSGTAFIMADILRTAVDRGTGKNARIYPDNDTIPTAGKTGTTSNNYNLWFCGFTPYYAGALWVGNDVNLELVGAGGSISATMWSKIMAQIHEGLPAKSFAVPNTVTEAAIDIYSGKLATKNSLAAGRAVTEYFVIGTEPTGYDTSTPAETGAPAEAALPSGITEPSITLTPPSDEQTPVDEVEELPGINDPAQAGDPAQTEQATSESAL